jgi:cell division protein FtsZ
MTINLHLPGKSEALRPSITVVGIGGAGGNAVNNMINSNLEGVNFVVANTDAQALENAMTERRIQLGSNLTRGLGAGASPEVGRAAAEEALDEIAGYIDGANMVFITAGMGGGTGTGAAPVVARLAKERGILTVGVVTKPFQFEGAHRMRLAEQGLHDLQQFVDTLIVIPNQNLFRIANEKTTFADAFRMADEVLHSGVRGVTDLMIMPGLINLDFADIRTVMREMGKAMMGTGEAEGPKRAVEAAEAAISNPLLDDVSMKGARGVLINITGGYDMTLFEADEAATRIREEVDPDANIIFGATFNAALEGKMRVSVVATGIDMGSDRADHKPITDANKFYAGKVGFTPPKTPEAPKPAAVVRPAEPVAVRQAMPVQEQRPAAPKEQVSTQPRAAFAHTAQPQQAAEPAQQPQHAAEQQEAYPAYAENRPAAPQMQPAQLEMRPAQPAPQPQQQREPSFVSPTPAQPAQRSFFAQQEAAGFPHKDAQAAAVKKETAREHSSAGADRTAPGGNAMSFFQRMAGVGRVLTSKPEQTDNGVHVVEKTRVEVTDRSTKPASQDDYLEIPAFLRRQAN